METRLRVQDGKLDSAGATATTEAPDLIDTVRNVNCLKGGDSSKSREI